MSLVHLDLISSAFIKHSTFDETLTEKIGKLSFPDGMDNKRWRSEIRPIQRRTARQPLNPRILIKTYPCIFKNKQAPPPPNPTAKSSFSSEADFGEITLISVGNNCIGWWKLYINIKGPLGSIKKNLSCYRKLKRKKKTKPWLPSSQLDWTHRIKSYDVLYSGDRNGLGPRFQSTEENKEKYSSWKLKESIL